MRRRGSLERVDGAVGGVEFVEGAAREHVAEDEDGGPTPNRR